MARKSKTQRAKASANRAAKKEQARIDEEQAALQPVKEAAAEEQPKKTRLGGFLPTKDKSESASAASSSKSASKKEEKPKKKRFQFFRDVKAEMKRVTWPTKQDVLRWSGVVVGALLFFGVFVALLDNAIITPILVAISGLGA